MDNEYPRYMDRASERSMSNLGKMLSKQNATLAKVGHPIRLMKRKIGRWKSAPAAAKITIEKAAASPKVSVVVPTYNVEQYVEAAITSIMNQSLAALEIIVIDDGSSDNTLNIVKRLAIKDSRIVVKSIQNSGNGRARNIGVQMATAKYLVFADSDDVVPKDAYKKMYECMLETGSDFVCGAYERLEGKRKYVPRASERANPSTMHAIHLEDHPAAMDNPFLWSKMFVTEFWRTVVGEIPEQTNYEDQLPTAKAYARSNSFDVLPDIVYTWRLRPGGSLTQNKHSLEDLQQRVNVVESVRDQYSICSHEVYQRWLAKLLKDDYYYFALRAHRATDQFMNLLSSEYSRYFEELSEIGRSQLPYKYLKIAEALTGGQDVRSRLEDTLWTFRSYGDHPYRITRELGVCRMDGPAEHKRISASAVAELPINELDLSPRPTVVDCTEGPRGELLVDVYHGIPGVDPALIQVESICAVEELGATYELPYKKVNNPNVVLSSSDSFVDHSDSCIRLTLDPSYVNASTSTGWLTLSLSLSIDGAPGVSAPVRVNSSTVSAFSSMSENFSRSICGRRNGLFVWRVEHANAVVDDVTHVDENTVDIMVRHQPSIFESVKVFAEKNSHGLQIDSEYSPVDEFRSKIRVHVQSTKKNTPLTARSLFGLSLVRSDGSSTRLAMSNSSMSSQHWPLERIWLVTSGWGYCSVAHQRWRASITHIEESSDGSKVRIEGVADVNELATPELVLVNANNEVCSRGLAFRDSVSSRWSVELPLGGFGSASSDLRNGRYLLRWRCTWHKSVREYYYVEYNLENFGTSRPSLMTERFAADFVKTSTGFTSLYLRSPLEIDERGRYNQKRLQDFYFGTHRPPINGKDLFFECFDGKSFGDNVAPLLEELSGAASGLRVFVGVANHLDGLPENVEPVVRYSNSWYRALSTSRVVVTNNNFPHFFRKSRDQKFLQLWHGTPLKKLLFDMNRESIDPDYMHLMNEQVPSWDVLVAQNDYSADVFRTCFGYGGRIEVTGYPRNDALFEDCDSRVRVRQALGIEDDRVVILYMPTWRESLRGSDGRVRPVNFVDWRIVLSSLSKSTRDLKFAVLERSHHVAATSRDTTRSSVIDVTDYPSVTDLYLAADILVTDYSSAMFDFALTGKPIMIFAPDYEEYCHAERGTYFELEDGAPGPVVRDVYGLIDRLASWDSLEASSDSAAYSHFTTRFSDVDDGLASKRVASLVYDLLDG